MSVDIDKVTTDTDSLHSNETHLFNEKSSPVLEEIFTIQF